MGVLYLIYTSLGFAVVGAVALALIPRLRLSFVNVVLFIPGALAGFIGIQKLFYLAILKTAGPPVVNKILNVPYLPTIGVPLVCGILGGTSLVALKTFLARRLEHLGS